MGNADHARVNLELGLVFVTEWFALTFVTALE